jgi:hypothetical protein
MDSNDGVEAQREGKREFWIAVVIVIFVLAIGWDMTSWSFYGWLIGHPILAPLSMLIGIPVLGLLLVRSLNQRVATHLSYPSAVAVVLAGLLIVLLATARTSIIDARQYRVNNCWAFQGTEDPAMSGDSRWACAPGSRPYEWGGYDSSSDEGGSRECAQVSREPNVWVCRTEQY